MSTPAKTFQESDCLKSPCTYECQFREAQEKVLLNEERFSLIIRNSPFLVFQQDLEFKYVWAPRIQFPCFPDDLVGKTDYELMAGDDANRLNNVKMEVIEKGHGQNTNISICIANETRYIDIVYEPWRKNGTIIGILGYAHEVTALRRAEEAAKAQSQMLANVNEQLLQKNEELDRLNAQLQKLDKLKTEFVSMASHELKTPLTSMIAFAQTLLADQIVLTSDERKKFLGIIESEGMRLATLLNDLLDVSKIESGVIELSRKTFCICKLIQETIETRTMPTDIEMSLDFGEKEQVPVCGDRNRIKQVLTNFIDNAIRYGNGKIEISVMLIDKKVKVSVRDNGTGIDPDECDKIFEKFYRTREAKSRAKGNGLGLAIAKGIIEAHKGAIQVESKKNLGSVFMFEIPSE